MKIIKVLLISAFMVLIACSTTGDITNPPDDFPLAKSSTDIIGSKITKIRPIVDSVIIDQVRTGSKITTTFSGLENFEIVDGSGTVFLVSGEINSITFEQEEVDGKVGAGRLTSINGDYTVTSGMLAKISGGSECEDDVDCEDIMPPLVGYNRVCDNGRCVYKLP